MTSRKAVLDYLDNLVGAYFDNPFKDFDGTVLRTAKAKWFAILMVAPESYFKRYGAPVPENRDVLCLKCPPDLQQFLIERYKGEILPAYHMNKKHWIAVIMSSSVPEEEVFKLIELSYDLTK